MSGLRAVEIRRRISAPVAEVFQWWTTAELMQLWMSPTGAVTATVDLRVGGSFRVVMEGEGFIIEHVGEFIEIDEPRRLVFTWSSPYTGPKASVVTVELEPDGRRATQVLIVHSELPDSVADSHGGGWTAMLARLDEVIARARTSASAEGGKVHGD